MKLLVSFLAFVAAVAAPVLPVSAAPLNAGDFAAECADGEVDVVGVRRYIGGAAHLTDHCVVTLHADSKLVFKSLTITSDAALVMPASAPNTTIRVVNSVLDVAGPLELTAGCCAGDSFVDESNGHISVRHSLLRGSTVYLNASLDDLGGSVVLYGAKLQATDVVSGDIYIVSSDLGGTDGRIRAWGSRFTSPNSVTIRTSTAGRTVVKSSVFDAGGPIVITTGPGGRCRARGNIPAVACT